MRASQEYIKQMEALYEAYEREVTGKYKVGLLTASTAKTYLVHSENFLKWCRNDFVPGERNKNK